MVKSQDNYSQNGETMIILFWLYKKDNEFKEFCDNSDYIAMSKIYAEYLNSKNKGIAELNKIISDNPILNTKEKDL